MPDFVIVMAQGRSGSTAILRMLNAVPGVRIAGENARAFDHLRQFVQCYKDATAHHHSEFFRLAWMLPCSPDVLMRKAASFVLDIYNPQNQYKLAGFKEIRYGRDYDQLKGDIEFLSQLLPGLKIVFNTRQTDTAIKSEFWRDDPDVSRVILDNSRKNFERYHREHPAGTYMMPFEELNAGSRVLRGLFDFLNIEFTPAAQAELARKLK